MITASGKAHAYVSSLISGHVAVTGQAPTGIDPADPAFEQAQDDTCVLFVAPRGGFGGAEPILVLVIDLEGVVARYPVTVEGRLLVDVRIASPDGNLTLEIPAGTLVLNADGTPAYKNDDPDILSIRAATPLPPPGQEIVVAYEFLPSGITFSPEASLIITYEPDKLAEGSLAIIAYYDEEAAEWMPLETAGYVAAGEVVPNTVTSRLAHMTYFAVLAKPASTSVDRPNNGNNGDYSEYTGKIPTS